MQTLEKTKKDSIRYTLTEDDSLVLWRALESYSSKIINEENEYQKSIKLLAKVIYKSCKHAGTLEGDTEKSLYEDMI